jgi:hypothetical protein
MVRRSKGSSLIINLDMVKEEDKGRGFMTVHGTGVCFHPGFLPQYPGNVTLSPGNQKN